MLGPLLFNIYINDLFFLAENINVCNYADETTYYACDKDFQRLILKLEHDSVLAIEWFEYNFMKLIQDTYLLLILEHKYESVWANIGPHKIWESNEKKLLGVNVDRNLKFSYYILKVQSCKLYDNKYMTTLTQITNIEIFVFIAVLVFKLWSRKILFINKKENRKS